MNFKEVYSKANDELHGSDVLLDKILSAPHRKSFRIPGFIPVIAVAAMIAAVIAVPEIMKQDILGSTENVRVADSRKIQENPVTRQLPETDGAGQIVTESVQESVATSEITNSPVYYENPEVPLEEPVAAAEEIADVIAVNYVPELAGAEASVMSRGIDEKPVKEMTAEEYAGYIGKDISRSAVIPGDMTMESPAFVNAETDDAGVIVSEKGTYFAHSEDYERFAEINVTRTQDILIPEEGLENSVICGNQVIIVSDNIGYNVSFSEDGVQYFIRCGNVAENELTNLLISLNGGSTNEQEDFGRNNGGNNGSIVTGNDDGIGG